MNLVKHGKYDLSDFKILFVLSVWCAQLIGIPHARSNAEEELRPQAADLEKQCESTIEDVTKSIIRYAYLGDRPYQFGCGVIVSEDGYVLVSGPANAAIDDNRIDLRLSDNRKVSAKALGWSSELGVSMLQITEPGPWPFVQFAENVPVGSLCIAFGYSRRSPIEETTKPLNVEIGTVQASDNRFWFETSYLTEFSGHPLLNLDGKLIGINTNVTFSGIAYHAHVTSIKSVIDLLKRGGNLDRVRLTEDTSFNSEDQSTIASIGSLRKGESVREAVVRLTSVEDSRHRFSGTVITPDGYILTCAHHGRYPGESLKVSFIDGRTADALILNMNQITDVGLVKIIAGNDWPYAQLRASSDVADETVCTLVGYPKSFPDMKQYIFATQIEPLKSGLPMKDPWRKDFYGKGEDKEQSLGGVSGGGVFDADGRLMGILIASPPSQFQARRIELFHSKREYFFDSNMFEKHLEMNSEYQRQLDEIAERLSGGS